MKRLEVETDSPEATEALGVRLAECLAAGAVIALEGDLAAGKTCLVRGMARALGVPAAQVHSPTFTLVNRYQGRTGTLYHLDLYRLSGPEELGELGWEEICEPDGFAAIEWAERAATCLPEGVIYLRLAHAGENRRRIAITGISDSQAAALGAAAPPVH